MTAPIIIVIEELDGGGWLITHGPKGDPNPRRLARSTASEILESILDLCAIRDLRTPTAVKDAP